MLTGGVSKVVKHVFKKEEDRFIGMLLGPLRSLLLGNYVDWKRCNESWR